MSLSEYFRQTLLTGIDSESTIISVKDEGRAVQSPLAYPGVVKLFSRFLIQQPAWFKTKKNYDLSSGIQHCNAGVLVENPLRIQKQTGRKVSN